MNPRNVKVGQLVKTPYGLATVMKFLAPKFIACVIVGPNKWKPGTVAYKRYGQGEWIYIRGFDFEASEIIDESR